MKNISLLGSTGSIGTQSLDVCRMHSYNVKCLTANSRVDVIENQVREFKPELVCMMNPDSAKDLKQRISDTSTKVVTGMEGLIECAVYDGADTVLNSVVGMVGLQPTLEAIKAKKTIALANKETLVAGGHLVTNLAAEMGVSILPVDSEHSAIFQAMQGSPNKKAVKKIILTASGGPFFGYVRSDLENVTPEQAIKHPTWSMGTRITVDSATLMNKGFEVIEAAWLFGMNADKIDVIVHRESIIHSMVEYIDNTVIAQMSVPDMRTCIQYALTCPERREGMTEPLDLVKVGSLSFYKPDREAFPLLSLAERICGIGGSYGAALNGADEEAVRLFLMGKIALPRLFEAVEEATLVCGCEDTGIDAVFESDRQARAFIHDKYGIN